MEFDEYEYLEKTVENQDDRENSSKSRSRKSKEGESEKILRKRDMDEDVDGGERRSKRSRAGDEENGSRRDREREEKDRSSRRDKDRHRSSRDSDRERDKGDKDRDRERSSREKDRDRDKDKDRETDKEKETRERDREDREKERSRRSRSRSHRSPSPRRSGSRSRRHERDYEREHDFEIRDSRKFKDKKEAVEPEADPERDQRTVFAYQMPLKASERDVYEFFSKAGKVRDVRLIMDRNSRRSKGVGNAIIMRDHWNTLHSCFINSCCVSKKCENGSTPNFVPLMPDVLDKIAIVVPLYEYIEFYDAMSVPMAIALSGQLLFGQPVMVKPSEAEKNLVQSTTSTAGGAAGAYGATDRKLYVGNLHFNMTENHLKSIFEAFGPVELVQLPLEPETGHCKGFGFVQFSQLEHAKAAQSVNGKLEIAGRFLKISSVTDHVGTQDTVAKSTDLDDDEGGLALNAQSRALLMQKLDRTGTATSFAGSLGVPVHNGAPVQGGILPVSKPATVPMPMLPAQVISAASESVGSPTECLLLKNLFDPATETEPDYDLDIKEDVGEECSKFGKVKHIYVDKNSAGFVYLRFENVAAAINAQHGMHLRWFAGRSISAIYMQPHEYEAKFKGTA